MQTDNTSSGWVKLSQSVLLLVLALPSLMAIIRYRWPQVLLPIGAIPAIYLTVRFFDRPAIIAMLRRFLWNPAGFMFLLLAAWTWTTVAWAPDPAMAAFANAKVAILVGAAAFIAIAATTLKSRELFSAVVFCTMLASFGTIITALTEGALHHAAGCCKSTVQPELSAAAVFIAQFIPVCMGWFVLTKRPRQAAAMFVLGGCAVALSSSGASEFAFVAGCLTLAVGFRCPHLAVTFPLAIILCGFTTALYLGELNLHPPAYLADVLSSFHVSERVQIWAYYTDLFWQRPWMGHGVGVEQFLANHATITPPPNAHLHAHNEPLQIFVELGVIGAVLLVLTLASATIRLERNASFRTAIAVAPATAFATAGLFNFGLLEWWWMSGTMLASISSFQFLRQHPCSTKTDQPHKTCAP